MGEDQSANLEGQGGGAGDRAFVIGWPITHSRSPLIHGYWLRSLGLNGSYEKVAVQPDDLPLFVDKVRSGEFIGGNVTIPHKEKVFELVTDCDDVAHELGAINTLWTEGSDLKGTNTDAYGFLANLDQRAEGWADHHGDTRGALVLGAGGASRAVIYALLSRGFDPVFIANRTLSRAEELVTRFGNKCRAIALADGDVAACDVSLIVNTTSLGMSGTQDAALPIDLARFRNAPLVHDIVYTPLITPLLAAAKQHGFETADGLGMLLHQAVPGFEKWFGHRPEVTEELRQLVLKDLGETDS